MAQTAIDFAQTYATWAAGDGLTLADFSIVSGSNTPNPATWGNLVASYVAADYDFHRGSALSVWARASNSTGVLTNIAAGTDGHVLRRSGTALGFGTLAAGAFAANTIAVSALANAGALSVLGRAANSAGAYADIAVTGGTGLVLRESGAGVLGFGTINGAVAIADGSVSLAKLANITAARLIGRETSGAGVPQELRVEDGITMTATPGIGIAAGGVVRAMLANGSAKSVIGRSANSSGVVADISASGSAATPQVLSDTGSTLAFRSLSAIGGIQVLDKTTVDLQISPTVSTDLYSYLIPANTLTAGNILRVRWNGHWFQNDGGTRILTLTIILGGVTLYSDTTTTITNTAVRRAMTIDFELTCVSNTLQIGTVNLYLGTQNGATTGVGDMAANGQLYMVGETIDSTVNLTSGQTLQIQATLSAVAAGANHYLRRRSAHAEML